METEVRTGHILRLADLSINLQWGDNAGERGKISNIISTFSGGGRSCVVGLFLLANVSVTAHVETEVRRTIFYVKIVFYFRGVACVAIGTGSK